MSEEKKEEPSADLPPPIEQAPSPAADPKMILQELEKSAAGDLPVVAMPASADVVPDTPLITDAMRRLDELLARFRK